MPECRVCNVCDDPQHYDNSLESGEVSCNVRRFQHQAFTVWRCNHCKTLHSLQDIDYDEYYKDYPMQSQQCNFATRRFLSQRLQQLRKAGLRKADPILDYGCGNGAFVNFLRERGYTKVDGYDPYSTEYGDKSVLERRYRFVTAQDVLEHVSQPLELLDHMMGLVQKPDGTLVIGTPDASELCIGDPVDQVGRLHQPYHRHMLSRFHLCHVVESRKLRVMTMTRTFYLDTWFPFLNSEFIFRYWQMRGGAMEASFEPIDLGFIVRSPLLLFFGLLGRIFRKHKDFVVFISHPKTDG